jgi:hypothetical protein
MIKSISYPNNSDYLSTQPTYDIGKWMNTMRNIYFNTHLGSSRPDAVDAATSGWDQMERVSFLDWMKYYESGDHKKYKTAQHSYYVNDNIPNYFIPNPKSQVPSPLLNVNEQINQPPVPPKQTEEEKRRLVEDQRKKILGRLNSAEKLLSSHQGQIFAGPDFERLLIAIYELKKQIQTVNKISLSAQTCVDLIIRQANILRHQGYSDASEFFVKFAQNTPGDFSLNVSDIPAGGSQPQLGSGLGNNNPSAEGLGLTEPEGSEDGIQTFLDNLEGGGLTDFDVNNADEDEVDIDDDVFLNQDVVPENKDELVVEAQLAPEAPVAPAPELDAPIVDRPVDTAVDAPAVDNKLNMTTDQVKEGPDVSGVKSDLDALIDSAFANITVQDVIDKLESVNKIYRTRELSRQLALVDIMLNKLQIAPYFPSLGESISKQFDANNYIQTRLDEIISKLRGTMQTDNIDLSHDDQAPASPAAENAKQSLEQSEQKDKQRKELRQQMQDKKLEEGLKPEAPPVENVQQELAEQPVQVEKPIVPVV